MLTLKELKKVVKVAGMTKRVPSEKALEKEEIVVKEILSGECDITVYANGYVLYRENGKKTIFPLHSCKDYQYMDVKEDRSIMNEEFFDNENWYIRLLMEATDAGRCDLRLIYKRRYQRQRWKSPDGSRNVD